MNEKFTVEEIRKYILSKKNKSDMIYYLNVDNIKKSNEKTEKEELNFFL